MKRAFRIALLAVLLAALPLRGYAGVLMALCEGHHGGASSSQEHVHEHGDSHQHDSPVEDPLNPGPAASVCSVCASCCAGVGLATDAPRLAAFQSPGSDRIGFSGRRPSGFVPEHLDRPPLALWSLK